MKGSRTRNRGPTVLVLEWNSRRLDFKISPRSPDHCLYQTCSPVDLCIPISSVEMRLAFVQSAKSSNASVGFLGLTACFDFA